MYLKSIEMQGFKSFANKIVLDFENGITGIVGPNGSGKSNIADAVRWVLGEQSAKELRGAQMTDVIFEGTENRRPLSFAYVALTMDNSDHVLPVEYEEVTVARRVYRSGESEYLINGTVVRLKDVNELFYDTGIGKEGYSIIGQGQIEKIVSGKPEERRELIDEAVGIVKYKKRKSDAEKKLASEHDHLTRIKDILSELENQVGPLKEKSETAKKYLQKRDELKRLDVNLFILETDARKAETQAIAADMENTGEELTGIRKEEEEIRAGYEQLEERMKALDSEIETLRADKEENIRNRGRLNQQIATLTERISLGEKSNVDLDKRIKDIAAERAEKEEELKHLTEEKDKQSAALTEVEGRLNKINEEYRALEEEIKTKNEKIESNKNELVRLLNERGDIRSKTQRNKTLLEQIRIRKASLSQRLVEKKTIEEQQEKEIASLEKTYNEIKERLEILKKKDEELLSNAKEWETKEKEAGAKLSELKSEKTRISSSLEVLQNLAERYEGFGNTVQKVMETKDDEPGLIGTVSDLITTDSKYETAIETALGGNIKNIVTEDDETAKREIEYLKKNRFGRATFLPLSSVKPREEKNNDVLSERGVLGRASDLARCDKRYNVVKSYLLGGFFVCDTMDNAIALQRKKSQSLRIVTLEGELFSPGGSMTGGSFKGKSNVLGRSRAIEEQTKRLSEIESEIKKIEQRIDETSAARVLAEDDMNENREKLQEMTLEENTAKINYEAALKAREENEKRFSSVEDEQNEADDRTKEIEQEQAKTDELLQESMKREEELNAETEELKRILDEKTYMETSETHTLSEVQVEAESARQQLSFAETNLARVEAELEKVISTEKELKEQTKAQAEDITKMKADIEEINATLGQADSSDASIEDDIRNKTKEREELSDSYRESFERKDELSKKIGSLEKELERLNGKKEKLEDAQSFRTNELWEDYELTPHQALEFRDPELNDRERMSKDIGNLKNEIRNMGSVDINSIEEYKEVSKRYEFLKGQHDDLILAEENLNQVIDELVAGMKERFESGFEEIQKEFEKVFKVLFGGGKTSLSLLDPENILESGIRINCQPPGKKLQNMMQLSGGEKSLAAIALLFAIQNMKPSPFCLLDEIEAALDDSNVDRFAAYLHKLTKNTQFIIITHRRGTMKAADRLYGITMQEKGVSTKVSVNLVENDLTD